MPTNYYTPPPHTPPQFFRPSDIPVIYLLAPASKDEEKTLTRRYQGLPFLKSEANKHIFWGSSNIYKIEAMWTANNYFAGWEILGLGSSTGYP